MKSLKVKWIQCVVIAIFLIICAAGIFFVGFIDYNGINYFFRQPTPEEAIRFNYHCEEEDIITVLGDDNVAVGIVYISKNEKEICELINSSSGWYVLKNTQTQFMRNENGYMLFIDKILNKNVVVFTDITMLQKNEEISDNLNSEFQKYIGDLRRLFLLILNEIPQGYELYVNGETIKVN